MEHIDYPHPPITEAIIEIRFVEPIDAKTVEAAGHALSRNYANTQPWRNQNIAVKLNPAGFVEESITETKLGQKHSSSDQSQIAISSPQLFLVSQLPDYPGWDNFFLRFRRDWELWKSAAGYRKLSQLALRYINRIDLPADGPTVRQNDYLRIYAEVPDEMGPTTAYSVQVLLPLQETRSQLSINSGVVASVIPGHLSILLDQTVACAVAPPQRDDELLEMLARFRIEKNRAFELCITDKARELFRRG